MPDRDAPPRPDVARPAFERGVALVVYGLIAASLFTVWITGLVAFVVAWIYRKTPDPVARAHFRFQLLAADLAGLAVGLGAALAVSGAVFVVGPFFDGDQPSLGELGSGAGLALVGVLLFAASFVGTLAAAAYGALRLLQGREVHLFRRRGRVRGGTPAV